MLGLAMISSWIARIRAYAAGTEQSARRMPADAPDLVQAAAAWLGAGAGLDPRFPPNLEARFDADTEAVRLSAIKVVNGVACGISIVAVPVLWFLLPDARKALLYLFVGGVVPMTFAFAALVRTNLPLAVKEWLQISMATLMGVLISVMLAMSRHSPDSFLFGSLMLLGILSAAGARLSFHNTTALMVGLTVVFEVALWKMPGVTTESGIGLALIWAFTTFYLLYGKWQYEIEVRRSYGLSMLERAVRDDLAHANDELAALAGRDALTDLPNRRSYDAWMPLSWERAASASGSLGLVVIDIDMFKLYNDCYGHAGGDACLRVVAKAMRDSLRGTSDRLARVGGEEFAVLLPGLSEETCRDVAERLRVSVESLGLPHAGLGADGAVTISCGVASLVAAHATPHALLFDAADAALYRAKNGGRNRVCTADRPLK